MTTLNERYEGALLHGRGWMVTLCLVAALVASACDKAQLLAPTNSTLSVSADAVVLPSSGSTQVHATVLEQAGTPVNNGTTVRFSTNLGRVEPAEAQTVNGVARTTFFADGMSGVAEIRAVSGSASGGEDATNRVSITVGSAAVGEGEVTVRANPSVVPVAGGTVEVVATATGPNNSVLRGVVVSFTTNRGTLSAGSAVTDNFGEARVQLTTNRETIVTASVGAKSGTVTVGILPPATVTLAVSTAVVGQPTRLTVTPATGTAPRVVIAWGDGSETDLGIVSTERIATHVYNDSGSYAIVATSTDSGESYTNAITVTVSPRPAPTVSVSPSTGTAGTTVFTFSITPATGGAGLRNVSVDFGDGAELDLGTPAGATTVTHVYGSAGAYTVRVTQTDGSGAETVGIAVVTVN